MVLPLVPLAIAISGGATGVGGVVTGAIGGVQIWDAQASIRRCAVRYEQRYEAHLACTDSTISALQILGHSQDRALSDVIYRMRDFLQRHSKQVRAEDHHILDGLDAPSLPALPMAKLDTDIPGWIQGIIASAVAGGTTRAAVQSLVVQLAKASTGTAISTLRGVAAKNATLAFLGGGSLAAGGGGMAVGTTMLNVATAGPTVLVTGLMVKNQGSVARTSAEQFRTDVEISIGHLDIREQFLRGVRERAFELEVVLTRLMSEATAMIDLLESEPFDVDIDTHAERLRAALSLVRSVREVATAPIADEDYNLDAGTEQLIFKYRDAHTEGTNV